MKRESEGKMNCEMFKNLSIGYFVLDEEFKVIETDETSASLLNSSQSELISKKFALDFGPKKEFLNEALKGKSCVSHFKTVDGNIIKVCFRIKKRNKDNGYDVVFMKEDNHFKCTDGTHLHQEELTKEIEEQKKFSEFLYSLLENTGHDFKNPLQIMLGYCEILLKQKNQNLKVDHEKIYKTIYKNCAYFADMIEKLESFTSIIKRGKSEEKQIISIKTEIQKTVTRLSKASFSRGVSLEMDRMDDLHILVQPTILVTLLDELFKNLILLTKRGKNIIINLLKLNEQKGRLSIEVWETEDEYPPIYTLEDKIFPAYLESSKSNLSEKIECLGLGGVKLLCYILGFNFAIKKKADYREMVTMDFELS